MNKKFKKSWKLCRGITLIEVVAGVVLLGTLLVAVVMATGRLASQSHLASRRIEAYRALDGLLAKWWDNMENMPRDTTGAVPDYENWTWRTSFVDAELKNIDADKVTVEIVENGKEDVPLAKIDVLVQKIKENTEKDANKNDEKADNTDSEKNGEQATTRPDAG